MRIVIAEDSVLLRAGLARLLDDAGHQIIAEVGHPDELVRAVEDHAPDLAVIDVRLPPTFTDEGIRAAITLRAQQKRPAILVLSQWVERRYASRLLADGEGGIGYLLKDRVADVGDFLDAVDRVAGGGTVLDPEVVAQLVSRHARSTPLDRLTQRETEALKLMAQGRSNSGIAEEMVLSNGSVEKHINNIFAKLDLPPTTSTTGAWLPYSGSLKAVIADESDNLPRSVGGIGDPHRRLRRAARHRRHQLTRYRPSLLWHARRRPLARTSGGTG